MIFCYSKTSLYSLFLTHSNNQACKVILRCSCHVVCKDKLLILRIKLAAKIQPRQHACPSVPSFPSLPRIFRSAPFQLHPSNRSIPTAPFHLYTFACATPHAHIHMRYSSCTHSQTPDLIQTLAYTHPHTLFYLHLSTCTLSTYATPRAHIHMRYSASISQQSRELSTQIALEGRFRGKIPKGIPLSALLRPNVLYRSGRSFPWIGPIGIKRIVWSRKGPLG